MGRPTIDLSGRRFGRLLVQSRAPNRGNSRDAEWVCLCDCGTEAISQSFNLRCGHTRSCGCLLSEKATALGQAKARHAQSASGGRRKPSRLYNTWVAMNQRCHNSNDPSFADYGGRGISVCKAWRDSFETFALEMAPRPEGMSIDRIDNRFGYFYSNCRWATASQQARNKRKSSIRFPLLQIARASRCL